MFHRPALAPLLFQVVLAQVEPVGARGVRVSESVCESVSQPYPPRDTYASNTQVFHRPALAPLFAQVVLAQVEPVGAHGGGRGVA